MAAASTRIGSMFGKYKLNDLLGQGGMGEVYKAYDTSKDRTVALKILREELSRNERFRTRFQRESRAAAMLEEPHVIPIYDWGQTDGNLFIDMRLVKGQDLQELLKQGPLEPARGWDHPPDRLGAGSGARAGLDSSRHQAAEHSGHVGRGLRLSHRLRNCGQPQ